MAVVIFRGKRGFGSKRLIVLSDGCCDFQGEARVWLVFRGKRGFGSKSLIVLSDGCCDFQREARLWLEAPDRAE